MSASSSSSSSSAINAPVARSNVALAAIYSRFHFRCSEPSCRSSLSLEDLKSHLDSWLAGAKQIPPSCQLSVICCSSCRNSTCVGCGKKPHKNTGDSEMTFTPFGVVDHCCARGRLFGFWVILARYDNEELQLNKIQTKVPKKSKKALNSGKPTGVGYSGPGIFGGELFGHYDEDEDIDEMEDMMIDGMMDLNYAIHLPVIPDDDLEDEDADFLMAQVLTLLVAFLKPGLIEITCNFADDVLVLLRNSFLFGAVTALMRNDSITEMTCKRQVYEAAFEFLRAIMAYHESVSVIIVEPRLSDKNTLGLQALCQGTGTPGGYQNNQNDDHIQGDENSSELSASLFECTRDTYRQAKVYLEISLKSAQNSPKKASIRLCTTLIELYTEMQNLPMNLGLLSSSAVESGDAWTKYAQDNRVTFTEDVLFIHSYPIDKGPKGSDSHRGRLTTIGKEIANMTTSLPVGIFLKVAESRSDFMKALIIGPEGSPYAGGLFPFDIYLDSNYPLTPPKVKFVLPGNQTGMNPNLHPGGTVCLSLLNTWNGGPQERWQPNKSTILSALVSIQAMIIGAPFPWLNEPGFENQGDSPKALEYNLQVQCKTVKYAMLCWLKKPIGADAVWTEVSEMYWKCNGAKVLQGVQEWKLTNKLLTKFSLRAINTHPHHHPHHQPPGTKKSKSKAVEERGENLVDMLAEGLGLKQPEVVEIPDEPAAGCSSTRASKGKRSVQESSDTGVKRLKSVDGGSTAPCNSKERWRYSGPRDLKTVRIACEEVGSKPAKSIKDSIERLERFVKDNELMNSSAAENWGEILVGGGLNRLTDEEDDVDL